jgi:Leucine-rich repeat (LRR) protein
MRALFTPCLKELGLDNNQLTDIHAALAAKDGSELKALRDAPQASRTSFA